MEKIEQLKTEINFIRNEKYKKNLEIMINLLPDYFFIISASSTGKHHPSFSLNDGGLLRHTKAVARIAKEFYNDLSITGIFTDDEKDLMMVAIILHDGLKCGLIEEKYTRIDHPILMSNYIKENKDKLSLSENEILFLTSCIETHMGPWTTDYRGQEILSKPINKYQKFVHMCDYLASRKFLDIKFVNNEIEF